MWIWFPGNIRIDYICGFCGLKCACTNFELSHAQSALSWIQISLKFQNWSNIRKQKVNLQFPPLDPTQAEAGRHLRRPAKDWTWPAGQHGMKHMVSKLVAILMIVVVVIIHMVVMVVICWRWWILVCPTQAHFLFCFAAWPSTKTPLYTYGAWSFSISNHQSSEYMNDKFPVPFSKGHVVLSSYDRRRAIIISICSCFRMRRVDRNLLTITTRLHPCCCRQLFKQMELFVGVLLHIIVKLFLVHVGNEWFSGSFIKSTVALLYDADTTSQQLHQKRKQTETLKPSN